jgi:hypothetical protein
VLELLSETVASQYVAGDDNPELGTKIESVQQALKGLVELPVLHSRLEESVGSKALTSKLLVVN